MLFIEYWGSQSARQESNPSTAIHARINNHTSIKEIASRYLSDFPNKIDTYIGSVHYLRCLFYTPDTYTATLKAYYSDETSVDHTIASLIIESPYEVYTIPTGLCHRNLALANKTLTHYTVTIKNGSGNIIFPPKTYIVHLQEKKCIIYANRLGGLDTFFIEREKNTLKVERENYLKPLQAGFSITDCDTLTQTTSYTDSYDIGSGYITRQLQELYKELLISDTVFLVHNNNFLAVNIEKGSFNLYSDDDDIHFLDFKITLGFSTDFINSKNILTSYSSDYENNYE